MDLFDEVSKEKKEFPRTKSLKKSVEKRNYNFYQLFSFWLFVIIFFLGIIFGNLFSTCKASTYYFSSNCVNQFNYSLMVLIWFVGFVISVCIFAVGHIIYLLEDINKKLN